MGWFEIPNLLGETVWINAEQCMCVRPREPSDPPHAKCTVFMEQGWQETSEPMDLVLKKIREAS